jgi:hypothetical protein
MEKKDCDLRNSTNVDTIWEGIAESEGEIWRDVGSSVTAGMATIPDAAALFTIP